MGDRQIGESEPRDDNGSTAENFMRSAKAPTMSAGVMQAKVSEQT
jgi:hypothetical protein